MKNLDLPHWIVLHRIESLMAPADAPFAFACHAEDADNAEEQCINAYPGCDVVWIFEGDDALAAYADYWTTEGQHE